MAISSLGQEVKTPAEFLDSLSQSLFLPTSKAALLCEILPRHLERWRNLAIFEQFFEQDSPYNGRYYCANELKAAFAASLVMKDCPTILPKKALTEGLASHYQYGSFSNRLEIKWREAIKNKLLLAPADIKMLLFARFDIPDNINISRWHEYGYLVKRNLPSPTGFENLFDFYQLYSVYLIATGSRIYASNMDKGKAAKRLANLALELTEEYCKNTLSVLPTKNEIPVSVTNKVPVCKGVNQAKFMDLLNFLKGRYPCFSTLEQIQIGTHHDDDIIDCLDAAVSTSLVEEQKISRCRYGYRLIVRQ